MILDEGYDSIVMDGLPWELYSSVPSAAQRTLMLYDPELRMIWNGEHRFHLIVRRSELRHPIRVADRHMVGWFPVLSVEHGVSGMEAIVANLRAMDRWMQHGNDPKKAEAAMQRESRDRKAAADAAHKEDDREFVEQEFVPWAEGQKVYSVGGAEPGKQDATRKDYRILDGVTNEALGG